MTSQNPNPYMDDPTTDLSRVPTTQCYVLASSQEEADRLLRSYAVYQQQFTGEIKVLVDLAVVDIDALPPPPMPWCITGDGVNIFVYKVLVGRWGGPNRADKVLGVVNVGKAIRTPNNPQARLPVR